MSSTLQTLNNLASLLQTRAVASRTLVETCFERIDNPTGQGARAFIELYKQEARASADAIDILRQHGRAPSRFAGIPISIKDLFDVAGETTRAGSRVLTTAPKAAKNAAVVDRLLAAGLILIGRTNMTEFAFSGVGINPHYGTPLSSWDRTTGRIPGGSSSGAAVSVSDGFAFAAIGTDTGGSCRIPAALCGIVGFKPTARRVSRVGVLPLSPTLDSVGPLANSVACCATMDAILAGVIDREIDPIAIAGLRFVLPTNFAFDHLDYATEKSLDRAVAMLDSAGAIIDRRPLQTFDAINRAQESGGFAAVEAYAWHRPHLEISGDTYDPRVASRIVVGREMTGSDYFLLLQARTKIIRMFETEMAPYHAVIMPTVPLSPPALSEFANDDNYRKLNYLLLRNPSSINFVDGCAVSIPCNAAGDPPAGFMIAAPAMDDERLLSIGMAVEALLTR